jgi:hypothetical protein
MPFGDGTGPLGLGPRTGRGLGRCAGYPYPGYLNPTGRGRGRGFGRGWGRGWGWWNPYWVPYYTPNPPTTKEEKEMLTDELKALKDEMKVIEDRLKELESKKSKK